MPSRRTEAPKSFPFHPVMIAIVLAVLGWAGLLYLVNYVHPTLPVQAAFLVLWGVALIGTAFPVMLALHRRFLGERSLWTVWRQSAWIGIFGVLVAWLQLNRVLNVATAAILAGVLIVLEVILSLRARQETHED